MPNPIEVATITVNGQQFKSWKTVSVERSFVETGSLAEVSVIDTATTAGAVAATQPIVVGSAAQVSLGGVQVLDGFVSMRQAVLTPEAHGVLIRISSNTILTVNSSVTTSPGQFKGYTISALANSILSPLGLTFKYGPDGAPPGAENPFERVSLLVGEGIHDVIARLARMRNLFLTDDAQGNVVASRATGAGGSVAQLTEGQNFKSGTAVLRNDSILSQYKLTGQNFGSDEHWGAAAAAVSASAAVSGAQPGTFKNVNMPMVGNSADAAMHLNRVIADDKSTAFDITITTKGWFTSDGNLWMALIGKPVTLISPTLLPAGFDQSKIRIKGVTHKQNDATGTETELHLCNSEALGANPLAAPDAIDAPPAASLPDSAANPGAFI